MKRFELARRALLDLQGIWDYIADDSVAAADRVIAYLHQAFRQLAHMPGMGHQRSDLTLRDVLFWPVHSYLIIYTMRRPFLSSAFFTRAATFGSFSRTAE